jgi:Xaa-Pro aminopeptidase
MKTNQIYKNRRLALTQKYKDTAFVISSGLEKSRSHSVHYRFKVASDFYYLTGLQLSNALLIILGQKSYLLQKTNQDHVWGEFTELAAADLEKLDGLEQDSLDHFEKIISDLAKEFSQIAVSLNRHQDFDQQILKWLQFKRRNQFAETKLLDSTLLVGSLRAIKEESEIQLLRKASQQSSAVHKMLMQQNLVGRSEREISNWMEAQFLLQNMQWVSYETIVGSGERATTLHARATDRIIQKNELVLIDAGAEYQGYCADITRTIPSENKFTQEQKDIYKIVLTAQKKAIQFAKPNATLKEIHEVATNSMIEDLSRIVGEENIVKENFKKLMPHSTSHWIGLDVHDPCSYQDEKGHDIRLTSGMTFTIEPGLYFKNILGFEKYNNIGIRIEDDIVITDSGCEVMTNAPKEISEIEELRAFFKK